MLLKLPKGFFVELLALLVIGLLVAFTIKRVYYDGPVTAHSRQGAPR